jgi:hypothetical protein
MREFIDHCQNRTSYKWNAIRYDLQLIDEISEPERHKSLETHLQRLMDGGPYRNNPIREFIRHFKDTIQPSTIDFLKNAASNPSADRKTRAQCYQSLVDLKTFSSKTSPPLPTCFKLQPRFSASARMYARARLSALFRDLAI